MHKSWSALSLWSYRVLTAASLQSVHRHMHIWKHPHAYAHFCISLLLCKGIKWTFKERQRDWPGACRVPLLTTGGPGQIKTAQASQPALLLAPLPAYYIRTLGKKTLEEPSTTRWIKKEVILQWWEGPGCLGTEVHAYVCELKLKGQYKWARQFCKWCRGPVYIECTFTGDLGWLKNLNGWDRRRNRINSP